VSKYFRFVAVRAGKKCAAKYLMPQLSFLKLRALASFAETPDIAEF
jgi:hypothetical protein